MHCFGSCQSNCGHVALAKVWERFFSLSFFFFPLIHSNYFAFFTTIIHKEPNCFLQDASPLGNHQYALSLREKLSICSNAITFSSHVKAAAAVFHKISHFMFRVMQRLMSLSLSLLFSLWDPLLREGRIFKKQYKYSMWQWSMLGFLSQSHVDDFILAFHGVICSFHWWLLNEWYGLICVTLHYF